MTNAKRREVRGEAHRQQSEPKVVRRKERRITTGGVIYPDIFYPATEARAFIGLSSTQTYEHIAAGRLPPMVAPCAGSSARGYYGRTIIEIQKAQEAAAVTAAVGD